MSAFGFITNPKTKNEASSSALLSPSLVEDLYDSQQLNTFVNQSRTFTSTPSPPSPFKPFFPSQKHKKPVQQSYFSFIDDLDSIEKPKSNASLSGSSVSQAESLFKSAFGFIGPSAAVTPTTPNAAPSPPPPRVTKKHIPANNEMKLISATSALNRLESEKIKGISKIQRLYTKQSQVYEQLSTLKTKIEFVQKQKEQALEGEDFLLAETLQTQEEKMTLSVDELEGTPSLLGKQIFTSWQRVYALQEEESRLSKEVAEWSKKVREERSTLYMKFISDNEKLHEQKLHEIEKQGESIESEKSERAFDLGLWEQAEEDLVAREDDAIHEDLKRKKDIEAQTEMVQNEIKELTEKLKLLETQRSELLASAVEVDLSIQEKLKPFANERLEHEQEFERIEIRRKDIEEKASQLRAFEAQVDTEISRHYEEKERGLEELHKLDEQIAQATAEKGAEDVLNDILKEIETRDELVTRHQSELRKHRETIKERKKVVDTLQHSLYDRQQKNIHADESVLEMQQKLKSLARHKQLAIEARRFQNAAAWTNQINLLEKEVSKLIADQNQQQQTDTELENQLQGEQNELRSLEQEWNELRNEKYASIKLILEKSEDQLKKINTDDTIVRSFVELELQTISTKLNHFM